MLRFALITCAVVPALSCASADIAGARAASPTLTASPTTVRASQKVTLRAKHLRPKTFYTFLYVPTGLRSAQRFLGVKRSDKHGSLVARMSVPRIGYCGKATVYLLSPKKSVAAAHLHVVGCSRPGGKHPPPPPPKPHFRAL
jgi:hypothetical protein